MISVFTGDFSRYVLRRLAYGLVVVALVAVTVFVVSRLNSDPARLLVPPEAGPEQYEAVKKDLGLDRPLPVQFARYVRDLATGDFGHSYWQSAPIRELIRDRLPNTLLLVVAALAFACVFGLLLGVVAALRPGSRLDGVVTSFSLVGLSVPSFWLGSLLILVFAVHIRWVPTSGMGTPQHLVLPALTLALPSLGKIAQLTRATMIDELATPHILVARAKGLTMSYIVRRHALRNILVPIATLVGYESAYAIAGYSVVVETVFAWPGIGFLSIQAIQREDLILVQGIVIVVALLVVVINLVTDLLYKAIDPRIDVA